ncbi:Uncharacterised protein [uncultured Clostridium sp.]|nr:Uncharacterised protein [uncultured Clostridium sp.]
MDETKKLTALRAFPAITCLVTFAASTPVFAEGPTATAVSATDWSAVITALTGQISVSTIVAALATFVTAGIGIVFMWWGVRKGVRSLMSAFRKGKMSV